MNIGETAALSAAILWAFSSLLYAETKLTAWGMNFSKIAIAVLILVVQLAILALKDGTPFLSASNEAWGWLAISGLIGLTIGDTCYFRSLQILGARRCLIVTTTAPVFAALLGWFLLGEVLIWISVLGIVTTMAGIVWVIREGDGKDEEPGHFPGTQRAGIFYGVVASVCQAVGGVASKIGMEDLGALEATFIRMLLAGVFAGAVIGVQGNLGKTISQLVRWELMRKFLPAVLCGTWLGVWFSQVAFKNADVGIAQTLLATCPLFAIPMVRIKYGAKITTTAMTGSIIAVVGICLVVLPDPEVANGVQQRKASQAADSVSREVPPTERAAE
jgi:drug/metabolite transporter (DMT)-like permease